jgi:UDP-2,4-diacetamido-2,4,6-trideoxy-beta-L-altropyranose hydrolase
MNVYFRVDASVEIGTGHLLRCLSLAAGLKKRGVNTFFISRDISPNLSKLIAESGSQLIFLETKNYQISHSRNQSHYSSWLRVSQEQDAKETIEAIGSSNCHWLVVDHYAIDVTWHRFVKEHVNSIFVIDDLANRDLECDLLLDQNLFISQLDRYANKNIRQCKELLGPKYALLRDEFSKFRKLASIRGSSKIRSVLIALGGTDHNNVTLQIAKTLSSLKVSDIAFQFVVGALYPYKVELRRYCIENSFLYLENVSNMAELMMFSDLAIGACGSSTWERCALGLPTIPVVLADNQAPIMREGFNAGIFLDGYFDARIGNWAEFSLQLENVFNGSLEEIRKVSKNCFDLVDGLGISRICEELLPLQNHVELREVNFSDSETLFRWRNSLEIRQVSRSQGLISPEEHNSWLEKKILDVNCVFLIGKYHGDDIGIVRFDSISKGIVEVSIFLDPIKNIKGIGTHLLESAELTLIEQNPDVCEIHAEVLKTNLKAHSFFKKNGYTFDSTYYKKILNRKI